MLDPRLTKLAEILVNYSTKIKNGDKVIIDCYEAPALPLAQEVFKACIKNGAFVEIDMHADGMAKFYIDNASKEQLNHFPEIADYKSKWADVFIRLVSERNDRELANCDKKKMMARARLIKPIKDRLLKKRWVLFYYPTESMAQNAKMSLEELEEIVFDSCLRNWEEEQDLMTKLKKKFDSADKVRIKGKNTDLTFSIKGRTGAVCAGQYNMPDGEVFTCPVEDSVNGRIFYEFPSVFYGGECKGIFLEFKDGQVVNFKCGEGLEHLKNAIETDEGAKRFGEFAIGTNYGIKQFMYNTLFDEKIGGTIHTALGSAYNLKEDGGGENKSAIHWDLIKDTRVKGSKVFFDGKPILVDGEILVE